MCLVAFTLTHMYQQIMLPKWWDLNESGDIAISDVQIASFVCVSCCLLKHYTGLIRYKEAKLKLLKKWAQNLIVWGHHFFGCIPCSIWHFLSFFLVTSSSLFGKRTFCIALYLFFKLPVPNILPCSKVQLCKLRIYW